MKEKRYFCDWIEEKWQKVWFIIFGTMTVLMTLTIFYFLEVTENHMYSEEKYQKIGECIDYFLSENEFNSSQKDNNAQISLPKNIVINVRKTDEGTILTAYYDDNNSFENLSISVNLSSIEKEKIRNYNSLDEFKDNNAKENIFEAIILSIFLSAAIAYIMLLILGLFSYISKRKKYMELGIEE